MTIVMLLLLLLSTSTTTTAAAATSASARQTHRNAAIYAHVEESYHEEHCREHGWGDLPTTTTAALLPTSSLPSSVTSLAAASAVAAAAASSVPLFDPTNGMACSCGMLRELGASVLMGGDYYSYETTAHSPQMQDIKIVASPSTETAPAPAAIAAAVATAATSTVVNLAEPKVAPDESAAATAAAGTFWDPTKKKCRDGMAEDETGTAFPCKNVDLIAHLPATAFRIPTATTTTTTTTEGKDEDAVVEEYNHPILFNDIWGWTSSIASGSREIIVVGVTEGTFFVEIVRRSSAGRVRPKTYPVILGYLPGNAAKMKMFHDMKVINDYVFIVSQSKGHGMQILNMNKLLVVAEATPTTSSSTGDDEQEPPPPPPPPTVVLEADGVYTGTEDYPFNRAHNIVANEDSHFVYLVGHQDSCNGGLHIVDVSDPINPVFVACYGDDGYVHDAQCVTYKGPDARYYGAELCFCYNENTITIIDVTNKANIHLISRTSYPDFSYVHQGWLSTDQTHLVFDDEYDEITNPTKNKTTRTMMLNIVDLQQPTNFQEHFGTTATVDHNLYIRKATDPGQPASATAVSEEMASLYGTTDLIYQANYEAGLRILQSIDIENGFLEEIGYFDTVPQSNKPALNGAWSVYPFFDSGLVVINSMYEGLFIVQPDLKDNLIDPTSTMAPSQSLAPTNSPTKQPDCIDTGTPWLMDPYKVPCEVLDPDDIVAMSVSCLLERNEEGILAKDACPQCGRCVVPPTMTPSTFPSVTPTTTPTTVAPTSSPLICTNTKKTKFKVKGMKQEKRCDWYAKKGRCHNKIADKDGGGRVFSACAKSCGQCAPCVNTNKGRKFKVQGVQQEKRCGWYAKKGKCRNKVADKDGGGRVFSACAKSCGQCAPIID